MWKFVLIPATAYQVTAFDNSPDSFAFCFQNSLVNLYHNFTY